MCSLCFLCSNPRQLCVCVCVHTCTYACEANTERKKRLYCLCVCVRGCVFSALRCRRSQATCRGNEFGLLHLNTFNLPVGDVRRYFYAAADGIQQERRNLSKYSFGATGRRNQCHKNRALNRVPLKRLFRAVQKWPLCCREEGTQRPRCFQQPTI